MKFLVRPSVFDDTLTYVIYLVRFRRELVKLIGARAGASSHGVRRAYKSTTKKKKGLYSLLTNLRARTVNKNARSAARHARVRQTKPRVTVKRQSIVNFGRPRRRAERRTWWRHRHARDSVRTGEIRVFIMFRTVYVRGTNDFLFSQRSVL